MEKNNIKVLITYPFRFSKHGLKLKELVKSRKLGKFIFSEVFLVNIFQIGTMGKLYKILHG